ncbi:MAG: type VII secretion protein EssC [bacterium]|nr:type VII secretion protein EssC [bacterium]
MRVSLIKNGKIYNTNLPEKISGSFWIEDKDKNGQKRNLINIEAINNRWLLKSNFETKIIDGNTVSENIYLDEFKFYELEIKGEKSHFLLYTSPIYDNNTIELEIIGNNDIYIGNGTENSINYNVNFLSDKQIILTKKDNYWHIKNTTNNNVLFVNKRACIETDLFVGDIIFIMGLKIIICGSYFVVNSPNGLMTYNQNILRKMILPLVSNDNVKQIIEDEELKVYEKGDYFFRMPRFIQASNKEEIIIDAPPGQEKKDEMPLAYTLGPMITMGITSMVTGITSISSVMSGSQTLTSALPSLITCVAMLLSMILWPMLQKSYSNKQSKKREKKRIEKYNAYIDEKRKYIREAIFREKQALIDNNATLDTCIDIIKERRRNLWERKIEHDDFLTIRVGTGEVESYIKVNCPEEHFTLDENNLQEVYEKLDNESKTMTDVPVTVDFTKKNITAIVGNDNLIKPFMDSLLLQVMTFHSYEDLKIVIMTNEENCNRWKYLKNTPFCWDDDKALRFFSTSVDEATQISTYLDNYFTNRKYEDGDINKIRNIDYKSFMPYFFIIIDDYQSLRNIEIIKNVLSSKINIGFSLLFVQERLLGLPNECSTFISIDSKECGIFENQLSKDKQQTFKADFLINYNISHIAKLLSNIPIEMAKDRYSLPNKLGFLEMYGVGKIDQLNISNRWKNNNPITSLSVPVGVDTNGELFKLDLHEKFHGPHGLVAGMTGSGKSEFIITYILSMAINFHPSEVAFVLIDYKGGGLAGAFENKETGIKIPHLAGTLTNLDVNDMKRSLASIQSELKRRQKIFNEARQNLNESTIDIYKYQRLRREGKVSEAVPHLFIISDEFAELKSQQPDFMDQLISTARIGRSLGVHLILATQKPNGVVDDQIWSNTKFRVCLKVQDKSDSMDMIKCPDAASLHNVGRFYLQVGYNEFFALGQSAYAGVQYQNTDKIKKKIDTSINFVNNVGYIIKSIDIESNNEKIDTSNGEELSNIVNYLYQLGTQQNCFAKKLWLDKIPGLIYVDELAKKYNYQVKKFNLDIIIGEYDDPQRQSQHLLTLPISDDGNLIIYGAAGSGKEDLLSTIIFSSIIIHGVDELNYYIIDCGSETLKQYENMPQIGDVVLSSDSEKIANLIKMLKDEIDKRKKIFSEFGGSYKSYCSISGKTLPNIIVIVNLYEAFEEMYPDYEEDMVQLTREGIKYGIYFILSTSGVNFIRYKLKQNFKQNIVLQLNDENDYSDVVGNTHGLYPSKIKGRGLIKLDEVYEFQSAQPIKTDNYNQLLKQLDIELNNKFLQKAPKIPILPKIVKYEDVIEKLNGLKNIPLGIEKDTLNTIGIDLTIKPVTLVSSTDSILFESFIPEFIKVLNDLTNYSVNIIDGERLFEDCDLNCKYYKDKFEEIIEKLNNYCEKLNKIYVDNNYDFSSIEKSQGLIIVIVGLLRLKEKIQSEYWEKITNMFTLIKDLGKVNIIIVDTCDNIKQFEYEDWYAQVVSKNNGIWIGDGITDQYIINLSQNPSFLRDEILSGFGFAIKKGKPHLIKLLSNMEDEFSE